MSREIKFRAWDKLNKVMILKPYARVGDINTCFSDCGNYLYLQYTGLKDKNGVELYEGDIVVWYVNDVTRTGEVYYGNQSFDMRNNVTGYGYIGWDSNRGEIEVIGNIHETPERLKQERVMGKLKRCPCGRTPEQLHLAEGSDCKRGWVSGGCCNEWSVEFRTTYTNDEDILYGLAVEAWNNAERGTIK